MFQFINPHGPDKGDKGSRLITLTVSDDIAANPGVPKWLEEVNAKLNSPENIALIERELANLTMRAHGNSL